MDFGALVTSRRSVRGFREDPVPRELLVEVVELAKRAPSSMNTQPWHFHAITGAPAEPALGWPKLGFSANDVVSRPVETAAVANFIGFDE